MDIGEVAKKTGLTAATLRYYEKLGLIQSTNRHGLRRVFSNDIVQKLRLIILLKNNCFTLKEIKDMLDRDHIDRQFLAHKINHLSHKIQQLTLVRDTFNHILQHPEQQFIDCKVFEQLLINSTQSLESKVNQPTTTQPQPQHESPWYQKHE